MKKTWIWAAAILAALAVWWFFFMRRPVGASRPAVATTGTAGPLDSYFSLWNSFNVHSLDSTSKSVQNAVNSVWSLANNFGKNDGGNSGGVSVSGSSRGGVQSSGSGAGVPLNTGGGFITGDSNGFA